MGIRPSVIVEELPWLTDEVLLYLFMESFSCWPEYDLFLFLPVQFVSGETALFSAFYFNRKESVRVQKSL